MAADRFTRMAREFGDGDGVSTLAALLRRVVREERAACGRIVWDKRREAMRRREPSGALLEVETAIMARTPEADR